jgi:hypothetical protein
MKVGDRYRARHESTWRTGSSVFRVPEGFVVEIRQIDQSTNKALVDFGDRAVDWFSIWMIEKSFDKVARDTKPQGEPVVRVHAIRLARQAVERLTQAIKDASEVLDDLTDAEAKLVKEAFDANDKDPTAKSLLEAMIFHRVNRLSDDN